MFGQVWPELNQFKQNFAIIAQGYLSLARFIQFKPILAKFIQVGKIQPCVDQI